GARGGRGQRVGGPAAERQNMPAAQRLGRMRALATRSASRRVASRWQQRRGKPEEHTRYALRSFIVVAVPARGAHAATPSYSCCCDFFRLRGGGGCRVPAHPDVVRRFSARE